MNSIAFYFRRGILYSFAGALSKLIPARIFRFRYFVVFKLKTKFADRQYSTKVECLRCDRIESVNLAEKLSRFVQSQFKTPVKATLAKLDGNAVGSLWSAHDSFVEQELGIEFQLGPSQRWLFGAMVDKPFRGQQVFSQLLRFTIQQLAVEGAVDQYASVNPLNKSSMAVFESHSHAIIARGFAVRVLGLSFCRCSGSLESQNSVSFDCNKKPIQLKIN